MQQRSISECFLLGKRGSFYSVGREGSAMAWEVPAETTVYENKCCVCGGGGECKEERMVWLLSYRGDQD